MTRLDKSLRDLESLVRDAPCILDFELIVIMDERDTCWTVRIQSLTVKPIFRGCGAGSNVMKFLTSWADLMGVQITAMSTDRAKKFYKKFGFKDWPGMDFNMCRMPGAKDAY